MCLLLVFRACLPHSITYPPEILLYRDSWLNSSYSISLLLTHAQVSKWYYCVLCCWIWNGLVSWMWCTFIQLDCGFMQILVDVGVPWSCSWGFRYFAIPPPGRCPCRHKNRCKRKWEACNDVEKWTWTCHFRGKRALSSQLPLNPFCPLTALFHISDCSHCNAFWVSSAEVLVSHPSLCATSLGHNIFAASIGNWKELHLPPGGHDVRRDLHLRLLWYKATRNRVIWTLYFRLKYFQILMLSCKDSLLLFSEHTVMQQHYKFVSLNLAKQFVAYWDFTTSTNTWYHDRAWNNRKREPKQLVLLIMRPELSWVKRIAAYEYLKSHLGLSTNSSWIVSRLDLLRRRSYWSIKLGAWWMGSLHVLFP